MNFAIFTRACSYMRSGFFGKRMHAAMDVGIRAAIKIIHRFDDCQRLLRRGSGIKINQRNTGAGLTLENGKIFANFVYVEVMGKVNR